MGILDDLQPPNRTHTCKVRTLLAELDKSDAKVLADALGDEKTWTVNGLNKALASRGIGLSCDAISRHRKGVCNCSRI